MMQGHHLHGLIEIYFLFIFSRSNYVISIERKFKKFEFGMFSFQVVLKFLFPAERLVLKHYVPKGNRHSLF